MLNHPYSHAALTLLALSLPAAAAAAGPQCPAAPIQVEHLEIGLFYSSEPGKAGKGIDHDLIRELAKRSGCAMHSSLEVRARTWAKLKDGQAGMTINGIRTPERDGFAWFYPYTRVYHQVLLGKGAPAALRTQADFEAAAALKFGVVRSYKHNPYYDPLLQTWAKAGRVTEYANETELLAALRRGEVAAVLSYPATYRHYLTPEQLRREVRLTSWDPVYSYVPLNLVVSKHRFSAVEAAKWGKLLEAVQKDGTLLRIFEKYLGPDEARLMLP